MFYALLPNCPVHGVRIARQNPIVSLGIITLLIPAVLFGIAGIGLAIIFHEGSTLVVVANALRLLGYKET